MAGRVVWGGRRGTRGLRAGGARRRLGKHPPSSGRHNAPRGPGSLFPQSTCPWARPGGTQPPPPPLRAGGAPPGAAFGAGVCFIPTCMTPPIRADSPLPPSQPLPAPVAVLHLTVERTRPSRARIVLYWGVHSQLGGGGTVRMAPGSRAELAAVGPWLRGAAGQNGDPAGPDLQDQPGHCYDASCPSPHGVLWLSAGIARSAEMLRGEREGRAGAPWQPPGSGGISLHVPQAPHIPYSGLTSSQLPPAAPQPGAQQCRGSLHPPWDTLLGTVTACSTCRRSGCP